MDDGQVKKVDESYKSKVEKEKDGTETQPQASGAGSQDNTFTPPEADFPFFITSLAMQATIALGDAPEPQNNKKELNLQQAKFLIDTLAMIKEKTANNLTRDESALLDGVLYELRMRYVEKSGGK